MPTKQSKCSKATVLPVVISVTVLISFVAQLRFVDSIPIQPAANSKNNYNENHAKRQLPNQPQAQWERPPSLYVQQQQFQQAGQNQGPEMEDFGRLYTNKNHFRRHAMPPDGKATPGTFHQNAPEHFGADGRGTNLRHNMFDESNQQYFNHINRFQPPPPPQQMPFEDAQEFPQRSFLRHNVRRKSQDAVPFQPPSFSNHFDNSIREEGYHHIPNPQYQQMLNDNEIPMERNVYQQNRPNTERESNSGQWQSQQQQRPPHLNKVATGFMDFPGQGSVHGQPNNEAAPFMPQPHPTAVALVVPAVDGMRNSTLFIEYDISDNDVTYETLVEIEDSPIPESNYNSHVI